MTKILVISDTQAPAHHPNTIEFLKHEIKLFKPDRVIHIGDELDLHNLSKYSHDPDLPGPKDELEQGLEFMRELYKLFPEVQVCISNHGARPYLRAKEAGIPSNFVRSYKEWMKAPRGWSWHHQIIIDHIAFIHGEGLSGDGARLKACTLMQKSCVFGHIHSHAGVSYFSNKESLIFGLNVGCLIDLHSPYFSYNKHQLHRPIIGIGLIDDGIPVFKPMLLDSKGLWVHRKDKRKTYEHHKVDVTTVPQIQCPKCMSFHVHRRGTSKIRLDQRKDPCLKTRRGRPITQPDNKVYGTYIFCNDCRKFSTV